MVKENILDDFNGFFELVDHLRVRLNDFQTKSAAADSTQGANDNLCHGVGVIVSIALLFYIF